MIKIILLVAFQINIHLLPIFCYAQAKLSIIDSTAFDRTIMQQVTYAITGENVPTGGVKVDLTKATGTVTGYIATQKGMDYSLDLSLGVTEGSASLFNSHSNIHSDFNATVNLIWIPSVASAYMDPATTNMVRANIASYKAGSLLNKRDSLACLLILAFGSKMTVVDKSGNRIPFDPLVFSEELIQRSKQLSHAKKEDVITTIADLVGMVRYVDIFADPTWLPVRQQNLLKEMAKRYYGEAIATDRLPEMYAALSDPRITIKRDELFFNDFIACINRLIGGEEEDINYQVKLASPHWNLKFLTWVTFSPFVNRKGFSLFDQTTLQRKDTSSVTYGLGLKVNWLGDWRKGPLVYVRTGFDFFRANNLSDFKKVEYVETDSITTTGTKYTYSEKKGISYTGAKLNHEFGWRFTFEFYLFFSRKNFLPGIYGRFERTASKIYENNYIPVLEFGLPLNVNSPDKKKSVVSIMPYIRFENLNAIDKPEIKNEIKRNDFLLGIRLGLPINVMSR